MVHMLPQNYPPSSQTRQLYCHWKCWTTERRTPDTEDSSTVPAPSCLPPCWRASLRRIPHRTLPGDSLLLAAPYWANPILCTFPPGSRTGRHKPSDSVHNNNGTGSQQLCLSFFYTYLPSLCIYIYIDRLESLNRKEQEWKLPSGFWALLCHQTLLSWNLLSRFAKQQRNWLHWWMSDC